MIPVTVHCEETNRRPGPNAKHERAERALRGLGQPRADTVHDAGLGLSEPAAGERQVGNEMSYRMDG